MSAPTIWILFPLAISAGLLFLMDKPRLARTIAGISAFLLLIIAVFQPIGNVLRVGSLVINIIPELSIFGRALYLDNSDRFVISLMYAALFLYLTWMDTRIIPGKFASLSLAITAVLISALAVQPFLYSAVLIESAILLVILMVRERERQSQNGILRFLIYLSLAMPCILFAGWILGGVQASTSDQARLFGAAVFLLIGFMLWLAVFPFHSWMAEFSETVNPFLFSLVFSLFPVAILMIIQHYISSLVWLRSEPFLPGTLQTMGIVMVVTAGIFAGVEKNLKRILAYTVLLENGFALLYLSFLSNEGVDLLYQSFLPRVFGLGLLGFCLAILQNAGDSLKSDEMSGLVKKYPFTVSGILISLLSISGFPLLASFPGKMELLHQIGQVAIAPIIWIGVGLAGFLIATIRVFVNSTLPDAEKWEIREKISQVIIISFIALILVIIGLIPQITSGIVEPFIQGLAIF